MIGAHFGNPGWEPSGMIFRVEDWDASTGMGSYAQAPQALVLEDRVRVFFSTRTPSSPSGSWISKPMFVDFSRSMNERISPPQEVLITAAETGAFDEHGIFPFSPLLIGEQVLAYTTGWSRRESVSVETGVGLMISDDFGRSFRRVGPGPVLSASLQEPFLVCDGFVLQEGDGFIMWYCFGTDWANDMTTGVPERTYKISQTSSPNPYEWRNSGGKQILTNVRGEFEAQALPSVARVGGSFWMVFCHRDSFGFRKTESGQYALGFAYSKDAASWTREDALVKFPTRGFDSEMRCYPNIFEVDGSVVLLFNGNDFGRFGFGMARWTG